MRINDFLALIPGGVKHASGKEWKAHCPAHDDSTESLNVTEGSDGRILLKCHAGCSSSAIVSALGLKMSDLFPDDGKPQRPARTAKATTSSVMAPAAPKTASSSGGLGELVATYPYEDANGKVLFEVCRFEKFESGRKSKTFRQRTYDPSSPDAKRDGYVWRVDRAIRDRAIYHLPKVVQAINRQQLIYVVEGEKDVENIESIGLIATCNVGGAGKDKWKPGHTEALRGARVVILADCDTEDNGFTGQEHAWAVASALTGVARSVKLLNIAERWELPGKGDISDVIERCSADEVRDVLKDLERKTEPFNPNGVKWWKNEAAQLFDAVEGYTVARGGVAAKKWDPKIEDYTLVPLTDFTAIPREIITRDDGANLEKFVKVDGWTADGRPLRQAVVKMHEFDAMSWVTAAWGMQANVYPGSQTKDKLRFALSQVGKRSAREVTEYTHTGWRRIDGRWVYLHAGGAIGADDVCVSMGGTLDRYRLDAAKEYASMTPEDGIVWSLALKDVMPERLYAALIGTMYLAPLCEFLEQVNAIPTYALFVVGSTQTYKTTCSTLALSHFGDFNYQTQPTSFNSTFGAIEKLAFRLKDMPLLVDDYHPVSSKREKDERDKIVQMLSRAAGDRTSRRRLNSDMSIRNEERPRGLTIITGEDTPAGGQESAMARFFVVRLERNEVKLDESLMAIQEEARMGALRMAMRGYIEWIQGRIDDGFGEQLRQRVNDLRSEIVKLNTGALPRSHTNVANIMLGFDCMLEYFEDRGGIDAAERKQMHDEAMLSLLHVASVQTKESKHERPSNMFIDSIRQLLISGKVYVDDIKDPAAGDKAGSVKIGYRDAQYYYFMPTIAYAEVEKLCQAQGTIFPLGSRALAKQLQEDMIVGEKEASKQKNVRGMNARYMWIRRKIIDGVSCDEQQEIDVEELPEEWKK